MVVRKPEGYTLLFLEIFIIIMNTLAIIVIQRFKKKYNPDILIVTLAIADLIKAFIPLNMTLVAYLGGVAMTEGSPKCIVFGWTAFTINSSIMLVMTIMAIDRYVAICRPFAYKHYLTKKRLIYAIIAVFVFSGLHSILPLVRVGRMRSYYNGSFCHFDFDSTFPASLGYSIFVLVLGISMLVVVIFCYTRAMFTIKGLIRRAERRLSVSTHDIDSAERKTQAMNHMFARLMIVMMIVFCISWLLFLIVVLQHVSGWFVIPPAAHFWSMRLAVINSLLNPIIGAAMCKPYRKGYMFILCKCLHCCGLCSSYRAENPWTLSRTLSTVSRNSHERDPTEPNNGTMRRGITTNPSFNSYHDSGIVPDSNDCAGSLRCHGDQDGMLNDAFEVDGGRGDGRIHTRPRLSRKRISFKDEFDSKQIAGIPLSEEMTAEPSAMSDDTTDLEQHLVPTPSNITKGDPLTSQDGNNATVLALPEVSLNGNRGRKYGILGIDQRSLEQTSLGRPHGNSNSLLTSNSDALLREGHRTEENVTHGEKTPLINTVSHLMEKDERATVNNLPKSTIIGDAKGELWDRHFIPPRESSFESVQITYFPVDTNSGIKTTTVKSPVLKNNQWSKPSCGLSPFSSRSGSFIERTRKTSLENSKARSRSFENDLMGNESDNMRQERHNSFERQHLIGRATTQQAHAGKDLFDAPRCQSGEVIPSNFSQNFGRAKSFESMLSNTPFKSDNKAYWGHDLPSFQRHSSALKDGQLNAPCCWYFSEPDLTRTIQETVFLTSHCRSPHPSSRVHSEPYKENVHNSYQRRAPSPQVTLLPPSTIYRQLNELSQKELEREVFC